MNDSVFIDFMGVLNVNMFLKVVRSIVYLILYFGGISFLSCCL